MLKTNLVVCGLLLGCVLSAQSIDKFHKNAVVADTHNDVLSILSKRVTTWGRIYQAKHTLILTA